MDLAQENDKSGLPPSIKAPTHYQLLFLYCGPYFAYIGMGAFAPVLSLTGVYALRLLVVPVIMLWAWRWYKPLVGPKNPVMSVCAGILTGGVGVFLWVWLLTPFVQSTSDEWHDLPIYLRLIASSLVVPVFEELFMRGYVFSFVLQWDRERKKGRANAFDYTLHAASSIDDAKDIDWNLSAIAISTTIFTLGHQIAEWPASVAYGVLMAVLLIIRKDLLSCIVAHGVTNLLLGIYVMYSGNWQYW